MSFCKFISYFFIVIGLLLIVEVLYHEFQLAILHHDVHGVLMALDGQTDEGVEVVLELLTPVGEFQGLVHLHRLQALDATDAVEGWLHVRQTGHHVGLVIGGGKGEPGANNQ